MPSPVRRYVRVCKCATSGSLHGVPNTTTPIYILQCVTMHMHQALSSRIGPGNEASKPLHPDRGGLVMLLCGYPAESLHS